MSKVVRRVLTVFCVFALAASAGCRADIDVAASISVGDFTTGWFDAGIVDGKNKLVPSATFTVTNASGERLSGLQVFSVFRLVGDTEELGSSLVVLRGDEALPPSGSSKPITVRANWGFTGEQPRGQMLMHAGFRDARVEVFAKYGAMSYVKLADVTVTRQLLTH